MNVWLALAPASEEGGFIVYGAFSTRRNALRFASTVPHPTYVSERIVDENATWEDAVAAPAHEPLSLVTRADLLAVGLDYPVTA